LILEDYQRNTWLIGRIAEGIDHEESLLQLPFQANCANWIVGHILVGRQAAVSALGRPPPWDEESLSRYRAGSAPITSGETARPFGTLLRELDESQQWLDEILGRSTAQELERPIETDQGRQPAWQRLAGLRWHESYHIGQLGTLRQYILSRRGDEGEER
jgi:hypothetical protein